MKILITGAAGFIGSHLALSLAKRGDRVMGIDNFNDYYSPALKRARAGWLEKHQLFIENINLSNKEALFSFAKKHSFDRVVHLAAQAGVRYSIENPQAYTESNLEAFVNVLELCRHFGNLPLTYASSSSVYGTNSKIPFSESDRTDSAASFYGATKQCNELIAKSYHNLYGLSVTGLRYFTVYGPWGRPDMALYSFTKAIYEGKPLHLFNHGKMERDFTYIDDVVKGTIAAMDLCAPCALFNIGNSHPEKVTDLIRYIEEWSGKTADIKKVGMQKGDVKSTYADLTLAKQHLNYHPEVPLKEGVRRFIHWYETHHLQLT